MYLPRLPWEPVVQQVDRRHGLKVRPLGQVRAVLGCNHARGSDTWKRTSCARALHPKARSPDPITTPEALLKARKGRNTKVASGNLWQVI